LKQKLAALAGLLALGLAGVETADAQMYLAPRVYSPGLPPYEIMTIVRSAGLAPLTGPVRRGPAYVIIAADRAGGQVRVVVDARYGAIVRITPVLAPLPYGAGLAAPYARPPRIVAIPPDLYGPQPYGPQPYGPQAYAPQGSSPQALGPQAPGPQTSGPPVSGPQASAPRAGVDGGPTTTRPNPGARTAAAPAVTSESVRTPLPRPRPTIASTEVPDAIPAAKPATAQPQVTPTGKGDTTGSAGKPETPPLVPVAPLE
jgi:hypothetical protein